MKDEWTIEQADNGMIVRASDFVQVIEDSHTDNSKNRDNLIKELGNMLYADIIQVMDGEITNIVNVTIKVERND